MIAVMVVAYHIWICATNDHRRAFKFSDFFLLFSKKSNIKKEKIKFYFLLTVMPNTHLTGRAGNEASYLITIHRFALNEKRFYFQPHNIIYN